MARVKAMVLAAGKATRLRPLTDAIAKPALSFVGRPILDRVLDDLAGAGVDEAVVNLHHAQESVLDLVRRRGHRLPRVTFSDESDELLGTGGALVPVRRFFEDGDFLVVNGDCVHSVDYRAVVDDHRRSGAAGTLAVRPSGERGFGALLVDEGRVTAFGAPSTGRPEERHFLSVQVLSPSVLAYLPETPRSFGSFDAWHPRALAAGLEFRVHETLAEWHALDSRPLYLAAQAAYLAARGMTRFVDDGASVEPGAEVGESSAVHRGAVVRRGARVERSAVLEDAIVGEDAVVLDSIVGPAAVVDADEVVAGILLAAAHR